MRKSKNIQNIRCSIRVINGESFSGEDVCLRGNTTYSLIIDYPFNKQAVYQIKPKRNVGLLYLVNQIYKSYIKKYNSAEKDDKDGYWHGIDDLMIEGIKINHKKKEISLSIGS